jgi:hypothetical protein
MKHTLQKGVAGLLLLALVAANVPHALAAVGFGAPVPLVADDGGKGGPTGG